jgi:hypothetical protein
MRHWNFVAMGQAGLTGSTARVANPIAARIARRTGLSEAQILAVIGAAFLVVSLVDFLRTVDTVITAGEQTPSGLLPSGDPPA